MGEPGGGALLAYRLAGYAAIPVIPALLAYRTRKGKEDPARRSERYGRASIERPQGPLVWIHAASVGETNAILPLVRRIVRDGIHVLFTTVTVTAASVAAKTLPDGAFHQFAPIDIAPFVDRFLDHWRPDLAIFVESELWPSTMTRLAERRIPQIFANAHMSERSFARWQRFGRAGIARLLGNVTMALAQSAGDGERLQALGAARVTVTGNIKFDMPPPAATAMAVDAFRSEAAGRSLFVAASTHEGEEEIVGNAHKVLRARHPDLLTIIAPRHPLRATAIRDRLADLGLQVARRSLGEAIAPETDIYLADTLGELGIFYRAAPIALIGGSLVDIGGHNPIEAVQLDTAILHGPHVGNLAEIYAVLDSEGRSAVVRDASDLTAALGALLDDPHETKLRANAAAEALASYTGALDATISALRPYLEPLTVAAHLDGGRRHDPRPQARSARS